MICLGISILVLALFAAFRHEWRRKRLTSPGELIVDALFAWARFWFQVAGSADAWRLAWKFRKKAFAIERARATEAQ
jgi:hypothetical protein